MMKNQQSLDKFEAVDRRISLAKNIVVTSFVALLLILTLGIAGYVAYGRYKKATDPDKITHVYAKGQDFEYGAYKFNIDYKFTNIAYIPTDCSQFPLTKPEDIFTGGVVEDRTQAECNGWNQNKLKDVQQNNNLELDVTTTNLSSSVEPISTVWFKILDGTGNDVNLSNNSSVEFPVNDLLPGEVRKGKISGLTIKKDSGNLRISVTLPGKAAQYVVSKE